MHCFCTKWRHFGCFCGWDDLHKQRKAPLYSFLSLGLISVRGFVIGSSLPYKSNISVPVVFISNILLGVAVSGSYITVFDMLLQHTFPMSPAVVMFVCEVSHKCAIVVVGEVSRLLLNFIN